jgi:putative transposase
MLRQQEQGQTVAQICREHSISEATFDTWKNKFSGLVTSKLKHIRHLSKMYDGHVHNFAYLQRTFS